MASHVSVRLVAVVHRLELVGLGLVNLGQPERVSVKEKGGKGLLSLLITSSESGCEKEMEGVGGKGEMHEPA